MIGFFQEESSKEESELIDDNIDDDDDDASWGVVFTADDIDTTDGLKGTKTKKRRPPVKKSSIDEKVIRCKIVEVDELDTDEEELPCVVGMAATPPQAAASYRQRKRSTNLRLKNFGEKSDRKRFPVPAKPSDLTGSKFWIGSSSELSSCSGNSKAKSLKKK